MGRHRSQIPWIMAVGLMGGGAAEPVGRIVVKDAKVLAIPVVATHGDHAVGLIGVGVGFPSIGIAHRNGLIGCVHRVLAIVGSKGRGREQATQQEGEHERRQSGHRPP